MKHRLNGTDSELIEKVLQSEVKKGWNREHLSITDEHFHKEKKAFTQLALLRAPKITP